MFNQYKLFVSTTVSSLLADYRQQIAAQQQAIATGVLQTGAQISTPAVPVATGITVASGFSFTRPFLSNEHHADI